MTSKKKLRRQILSYRLILEREQRYVDRVADDILREVAALPDSVVKQRITITVLGLIPAGS